MKSNIYYLFLALMALLLMSCGETPRTEKDSVIEYDVIEIDSCSILWFNLKRMELVYM